MTDKGQRFRSLHVPGDPLILFNIWDPGSAAVVARAGAKAIATGSWSVAAAHGYGDGEQTPFELVLNNLRRIVGVTELPVTIDLETGYGPEPEDVERSVGHVLTAGAVGINIEDGLPNGGCRAPAEQAARLAAARRASDRADSPAFVNARIDLFLQSDAEIHHRLVSEAIDRARTYEDAGADGVFVPGLTNLDLIEHVCGALRLPVNVMASPEGPQRDALASAGAARVSFGPGPYRLLAQTLAQAAAAAMA